MLNTTEQDLYLKLINSSKIYHKIGNTTINFNNIKIHIDPTNTFSFITTELLKKLNTKVNDFNKGAGSTRLSNLISSTTNENEVHEKIESIVARINLAQMFFGIVGNFICISILMQKTLLNRRFNWYLLFLAITDLIFCLIVFINYYIVFANPTRALYDLSEITCYFTDYVVSSLDAFCVFLTLILSIDRLYAIKKPIKSKMFFTNRFPKRIAFFGYLIILLIKSPDLFLSQREYIPASNYNFVNETSGTKNEAVLNAQELNEFLNNNQSIQIDSILNEVKPYCHSTSMFDSSNDLKENLSQTIHIMYIIYCNIAMPLLFNIIPAIIILVLNLALWFFMRRYTDMMSNKPSTSLNGKNTKRSVIHRSARRSISTTQKSHYFTIIILGIWLLITNIPYYSLVTFYWVTSFKLINNKSRIHMTIQAISSAFFNSNHCLNIILYMIFNKDFRLYALKILFNIFNLNPFVKLNPLYLKTKRPSTFTRTGTYRLTYSQKANFMNFMNDDLEEKTYTETKVQSSNNSRRDFKRKYTTHSVNNMSDDGKSISALNLNEMSAKNLFIPNKKLKFLKFWNKKAKSNELIHENNDEKNIFNQTNLNEKKFQFEIVELNSNCTIYKNTKNNKLTNKNFITNEKNKRYKSLLCHKIELKNKIDKCDLRKIEYL